MDALTAQAIRDITTAYKARLAEYHDGSRHHGPDATPWGCSDHELATRAYRVAQLAASLNRAYTRHGNGDKARYFASRVRLYNRIIVGIDGNVSTYGG